MQGLSARDLMTPDVVTVPPGGEHQLAAMIGVR